MWPFIALVEIRLVLLLVLCRDVLALPSSFNVATTLERESQVKDEYDYIIAGAGTAGLTVADRLSENGKYTVLVIEYCYPVSDTVSAAGGGRFFSDPGIQYNITSVPQTAMSNRRQPVTIGCAVGGSSAINLMIAVRGTRSEYDGWAELGGPNSTWNWNGVLPYFKKALHFTPPEEGVAKAFNITWDRNAWGQEPNTHIYASYPTYQSGRLLPYYKAMAKMPEVDVPLDGAGGNNGLFWNPTTLDPQKYWRSYARTGHYDNITRPNFEVITMHKVRRVLFNGTTATGMEIAPRGKDAAAFTVKARKEVILSAGSVHTPQILQLSGVGAKELLQKAQIPLVVELPGVGQNFQDHGFLSVDFRWTKGSPPVPNLNLTGDPKTQATTNLAAWLGLPAYSDDWKDIAARYEAQDPAAYLPKDSHATVIAGYKEFQKLHSKLLRTKNANWLWMPLQGSPGGMVASQHIVSHGTINIDPAHPNDEPLVDYRAFSNPIDIDVMVENIKFMRKFMNSSDFAPYAPREVSPGAGVTGEALRQWIRDNHTPSLYHPISTAAKKPQALGGVVDEELRVHGTQKLRVVDGSIIPLLPGANTQSTVYMLAEKAVDLIKATW